MGELFIEIDELTECLYRVCDEVQVQTYYEVHNGNTFDYWDEGVDYYQSDYETVDEYGWVDRGEPLPRFAWHKDVSDYPERTIYELFAYGDERPQGRVSVYGNKIELAESAPWNNAKWLNEYCGGGNKEYIGVGGHLFALAAKEYYDNGSTGDLFFRSVDGLQSHYHEMLGAEIIMRGDGNDMVWLERDARSVIDIYFKEDSYVE